MNRKKISAREVCFQAYKYRSIYTAHRNCCSWYAAHHNGCSWYSLLVGGSEQQQQLVDMRVISCNCKRAAHWSGAGYRLLTAKNTRSCARPAGFPPIRFTSLRAGQLINFIMSYSRAGPRLYSNNPVVCVRLYSRCLTIWRGITPVSRHFVIFVFIRFLAWITGIPLRNMSYWGFPR